MVFGKLFRRPDRSAVAARVPQAPAGMRIYAIGDIHGRDDLLTTLHARIRDDMAGGSQLQTSIVYLGDYIDRGLGSSRVIDMLLKEPVEGARAIHLKGNHEEAVLDFLDDASFGMMWRNFGGLETLYSYGVPNAMSIGSVPEFIAAQEVFAERLPADHLKWLKSLRSTATFGDYFFAHAGVRPGVPLEQQSDEDLLWIRDAFLDSDLSFGKIVVHGHTPEPEPTLRHNRIGVDTGAYMTDILTCVVLEGENLRFLDTRPAAAAR